jgi:hypothetical protein
MSEKRELRVVRAAAYHDNLVAFFDGAGFVSVFTGSDLQDLVDSLFDPVVILECEDGRCGPFEPSMLQTLTDVAFALQKLASIGGTDAPASFAALYKIRNAIERVLEAGKE